MQKPNRLFMQKVLFVDTKDILVQKHRFCFRAVLGRNSAFLKVKQKKQKKFIFLYCYDLYKTIYCNQINKTFTICCVFIKEVEL